MKMMKCHMTNWRMIKCAALWLAIICSVQAQVDTNVYRIDLSGHGYLKDVFDSGLRPKRETMMRQSCLIRDRIIGFDLGSGRLAIIPAARCEFKVDSTNQALSEVQAETPPLNLEDAQIWMLPVCQAFGRTETDLNKFLDKVKEGYNRFGWLGDENEGFGVGTPRPQRESGRASIGIRFKSSFDKAKPVIISVAIYWERPRHELDFPSTPLQPPSGYEQFSMEPEEHVPDWLRKGEEPSRFVTALYTAKQIRKMRAEYAAKLGHTNSPMPQRTQDSAVPSRPKLWFAILAVPFVALGWALFRRKRSCSLK